MRPAQTAIATRLINHNSRCLDSIEFGNRSGQHVHRCDEPSSVVLRTAVEWTVVLEKDIEIDHKFISDYLDDLRESVLALSDATHNPIDSWNSIEELSHMQQANLSEQARSLIKKQERRLAWKKREAKFGPVCNSPNLISDYLLAFSETPKSEDEFLAYAKKAYNERIKSSRTRYIGIGKSDKYVWKYHDIGAEKGLSPKESIILLLTYAGLSEERIAQLLMDSKKVKYPHAEEE